MGSILIKGGTIVNEGHRYRSDLLIQDGYLLNVNEIFRQDPHVDEVINAEGLLVFPGVIDDQVHFREPGLLQKGSIASESKAAVAGGITSFMEMPNTNPPAINQELLKQKFDIAERDAWCNYSFYLGATNDNIEQLCQSDPQSTCGIKVFMGSSTGNLLVDNDVALKQLFNKVTIPIAVHSEDEETIQRNLDHYRKTVLPSDANPALHPLIRSREACVICTERVIEYARNSGGHLHLLHISTAEEVELIRKAKEEGVQLTAEVCVHHLWFTDEDYALRGNMIKWNPAIKTAADREALIGGLKDGTLDIVATDHAPHEKEAKERNLFEAPSGGPLVQQALPLMLQLAAKGVCNYEQVVLWMAHKPADLFKIDRRGYIRKGYYADIAIVNPDDPQIVRGEATHYKVKWSPLEGVVLDHTVTTTIVNGSIVYHNGVHFSENRNPLPLLFNR